ncbi:ribonuclease H-like domain-containing protein [Tanacetum coccineum]|uniref:Ribonuclease H-like domain-containing protein n=1 Tax=Tanacetum coccineum TaxID=301880 RepID=A0ABQ4YB99_9ASTR
MTMKMHHVMVLQTNKPKQQQQLISFQKTTISKYKIPILKKEEYDIWAMEMEQYLEYIDNDVWKVIQNENSKKRISTGKDGVVRILPPVSAAETHAVEKERKARNHLKLWPFKRWKHMVLKYQLRMQIQVSQILCPSLVKSGNDYETTNPLLTLLSIDDCIITLEFLSKNSQVPQNHLQVLKTLLLSNTARAALTRLNVNYVRHNVNSVRTNVNTGRSKQPDHPLKNIEDRGIFDSGCSGHMTGNKDHLDDFKECKGGSVTFGGSKGYITGKGRIRVGNLDFDSVSFVKELGHFNLFSISQICDKHHKVLFTETECLVVSPDFKMPDENQILLKVPRQHNMYSFDMKTPSLTKDYACLIAKATSDESKLWHKRNKGIKQEYSNARTPQQNGVARKTDITQFEAARTIATNTQPADQDIPRYARAQKASYAEIGMATTGNGDSRRSTSWSTGIRTKWVYKNKRDERGVVYRNKEILVAQGHRQEEGIDYDEVFAPVARIEAIRESSFDLEAFSNSDYAGQYGKGNLHNWGYTWIAWRIGAWIKVALKEQHIKLRSPSSSKNQLPSTSHPTPARSFTTEDLLHMVPTLITKVDSLETELKQTKQTMGKAIVKLVNKVKKLENILKRRNVVLTTSEDEEPEDQGRIFKDIDDDPLVSFVTPTKPSREAQEEEISPTTLEAAKTLSKVASQRSKSVDKGKRYKRRKDGLKGKAFDDIKDWDAIKAKLEANAELAKSVIAKDMSEEEFTKMNSGYKEEYDIWAMEMEHYLEYIDNDVWKVIQNGNSKRISTGKDGVVRILPPVSTAEILAVEKERKARTILLIVIPKEHLRRFHGMDDAKEI